MRYILVLSILFFQGPLRAQQGSWKADLNYQLGLPLGDFKNVVEDVSPRGASIGISYGFTDAVSAGLEIGFQDFYQKYPRQVLHEPGSDISAVVTNSIQIIPILLKGKYRLKDEGMVQPFVGLGIGGNLVQYQKYYGQFTDSRSKFSFAARPEVGLHIPVGRAKTAGIHALAGYNFMPYEDRDLNGIHHAVFKLGASFPLR